MPFEHKKASMTFQPTISNEQTAELPSAHFDGRIIVVENEAQIEQAYRDGACFDGWDECFSFENWLSAFEKVGISPEFYANRAFSFDEILPWSVIDCGVKTEYLKKEYEKAMAETTTPDCGSKCSACGIAKYGLPFCTDKASREEVLRNPMYKSHVDRNKEEV